MKNLRDIITFIKACESDGEEWNEIEDQLLKRGTSLKRIDEALDELQEIENENENGNFNY